MRLWDVSFVGHGTVAIIDKGVETPQKEPLLLVRTHVYTMVITSLKGLFCEEATAA